MLLHHILRAVSGIRLRLEVQDTMRNWHEKLDSHVSLNAQLGWFCALAIAEKAVMLLKSISEV